jgi:PAS domain S-box-containing protein
MSYPVFSNTLSNASSVKLLQELDSQEFAAHEHTSQEHASQEPVSQELALHYAFVHDAVSSSASPSLAASRTASQSSLSTKNGKSTNYHRTTALQHENAAPETVVETAAPALQHAPQYTPPAIATAPLLPTVAADLLTRLYVPTTVVVNTRSDVLVVLGRSQPLLVTSDVRAYNAPIASIVHEALRVTVLDALREAIARQDVIATEPRVVSAESEQSSSLLVRVVVRPLSATVVSANTQSVQLATQTALDSDTSLPSGEQQELYCITFEELVPNENAVGGIPEIQEPEAVLRRSLEQSDRRYRELLRSVTDYTFTVMVENGRVTHTQHGPNCVAVTGYTSQEYYANPMLWIDMVHPDDRDAVIAHAQKILTERSIKPIEHRIIHKDGSIRWVRNTPVLHFGERGQLIGYDGLVSNITERKNTELQLRENEEQLRFILEQSPLGILLINTNNRIVKANRALCDMLGYSESELRRSTLASIMPPEEHSKEAELAASVQQGVLATARLETQFLTHDGETLWINLNISSVRNAQGEPVFSLCVVENITGRKQAEQALRQSEARLAALMQNANDAVTVTDEHGTFSYVSPSVARLFYYSPQQMLGKSIRDYIHPDDQARITDEYRSFVDRPVNAMRTFRYRFRRADGTWADVESVATNLLKHNVLGGIVANTRDVSIRHEDRHDDDEG